MKVELLFFGILKDLAGRERETLTIDPGTSVGGLLDAVRSRTGGDVKVWASLAIAVNREYATADRLLEDGDEVALLPPVSGGAGDAR